MARAPFDQLFHCLRAAIAQQEATDGELLQRFAATRDEAAFAALVQRHGALVLGVCRHVLRQQQDAEDAFQATFLVLARKAGTLDSGRSVAGWLHGVAYRIALNARKITMRRRRREQAAPSRTAESAATTAALQEMQALLDAEVHALAEKYRAPFVLCCLQGKSRAEAAETLGWKEGTLASRLAQARTLLQQRLTRRGVLLTAALTATAVTPEAVRAEVAATVARTAQLFVSGQATAVPAAVTVLARAMLRSLTVAQGKTMLLFACVLSLLAGAGLAAHQSLAVALDEPAPPAAVPPAVADGDPLPAGAVARLGSPRRRIGNSAFALTPDGKHLVAVSPEGIVRKFDATTGRQLERRQLTDRAGIDPTGQHRAQLSADGTIAVLTGWKQWADSRTWITAWDVASGKEICRLPGYGTLAPDGTQLAIVDRTDAGNGNYLLTIHDLRTGAKKSLGPVANNVYDVHFVRDGRWLVLSQIDGTTRESSLVCFDVPAGKELWRRPRQGVNFTVSPDGRLVLEASFKQIGYHVLETDPATGQPTESFKAVRPAHPNEAVAIAPDNRTVVTPHFGEVIVWDFPTGKEACRFKLPSDGGRGYGPLLGGFSADSRTVFTNGGHLQRWDLTTGKPQFEAEPDDGVGSEIHQLAFTAGGKELFATSWGWTAALWETATGKLVRRMHSQPSRRPLRATPDGLRSLECSPSSKPYQDTLHEISLFDPLAGKELHTLRWAEPKEIGINDLQGYSLSADGRTVLVAHTATVEKRQEFRVTLCDVGSGRRRARAIIPGQHEMPAGAFSPCGRWLVLADKVYDTSTGTALFTLGAEAGERLRVGKRWMAWSVWYSADSRLLAGRLPGETLGIWELATGKLLARVPQAVHVCQVAFAPDNDAVALLDGRGIRVLELRTLARRAEYLTPDVTCELLERGRFSQTLVFAPDGRTLATGHRDGTVLLWEVPAPPPAPPEITAAEQDRLWADLASESPAPARAAIERLTRSPAAALVLLASRFRHRPTPADAAMTALVQQLDSETFAIREAAARKLRENGTSAESALRGALASNPSLELRRRIEALLPELVPPRLRLPVAGETLRGVRAIEILERIGTSEARRLLQAWAGQVGDLHLAIDAQAALLRLATMQ